MALQVDIELRNLGVTLSGAYARIASFDGDKVNTRYRVDIYPSAERAGSRRPSVESMDFVVSTADVSGLPALYADLKARPGFTEALDV